MLPHQDKQEEQKRHRKVALEQLQQDYAFVFGSERGIRVLNDLFNITFIDRSTFTGNSESYKNDGKRSIGLYIQEKIKAHDSAILIKVLQERYKRR